MVNDARCAQWKRDAEVALAQFYGTDRVAGHLSAAYRVLYAERESLLRYINKSEQAHHASEQQQKQAY